MIKQKILYLVTQSEWGGAQEYIFTLASALDNNQYEAITYAGQGNGALFKALQTQNLPYQRLKYLKRSINPLFDLMALFELIAIFKKTKPNVIHLNSSKIGFLGALAAKIAGCPAKIIYTAHGWVFNEPLAYPVKKLYFWLEKISAPWKNAIICVAEADQQTAFHHNFHSKIVTIHNAVNPEQLKFLPKAEATQELRKLIPNSSLSQSVGPLIGTIANFYKTKGLNFLIEAVALLKKDFPNLKTIIIGEGEERQNLENLIKANHLENQIILTGSLYNAHQYLKAFDLFVLPSVKEGLPYAILKAMAAELPIVATRVGGLPEILPNDCLVGAIHESPLPNDLPELLANKIKMVLAGRLIAPKYSSNLFQEFLTKTTALY